jgi:hypothetical protein
MFKHDMERMMLTFDNVQKPDALFESRENTFSALLQSQNMLSSPRGGNNVPRMEQIPDSPYTPEETAWINNAENEIVDDSMTLKDYLSYHFPDAHLYSGPIINSFIIPRFKSFAFKNDLRENQAIEKLNIYLKEAIKADGQKSKGNEIDRSSWADNPEGAAQDVAEDVDTSAFLLIDAFKQKFGSITDRNVLRVATLHT